MTMASDIRGRQGYIGDLSKKTRTELLELFSRQEKLLANRKFISTLPDKGKKIRAFKSQLERILNEKRDDISAVADELARLRLTQKTEQGLDSDDDDDEINKNPNVWETLAANGLPTKIVSNARPSMFDDAMPPLETGNSEVNQVLDESGFYKGLAHVMDEKIPEPIKEHLKLNRPRHKKENVHQSKPKAPTGFNQVEEESAVRYHVGPHTEAKALTITESLQLQKSYMLQMKELQVKEAVARLAQKMNIPIGEYEPEAESKMKYREISDVTTETDDEEGDAS